MQQLFANNERGYFKNKYNAVFLSGADNLLGCLGFEEDKHVPITVVCEVILIFSATLPSLELL